MCIRDRAQGGLGGAKAGWQQQGAANKQQDLVKTVSGDAGKDWAAQAKNIQMSTGKPPTADDAVAWFSQFSGTSPTKAPAGSSPAQINQWLNQEVSGYMRKKASAQQPAGLGTATAQPTATTTTATTAQPTAGAQPTTTSAIKPISPTQSTTAQTAPIEEPVQLPIPLDKLSAEERAELRRQLQASLKMAA